VDEGKAGFTAGIELAGPFSLTTRLQLLLKSEPVNMVLLGEFKKETLFSNNGLGVISSLS